MPSRQPSRPQSAAVGQGIATMEAKNRRRKKGSAFILHVHVRDKIMSINVGEGNQVVYWLGVTAVQRYVRLPDSYSAPFSQELTPKAVISETGEPLDNNSRVKDEFTSGMHAWVDVGDGIALSVINSRRVIGFGGTFDLPVEKVSEKLSWCQVDPGSDEEERDTRLTMKYDRLVLPEAPPYAKWQSELSASSEEQYQIFNGIWHEVELSDLPGFNNWSKDVQAILYKYFSPLLYVFVHKAAPSKNPYSAMLEREEFWKFIKRCKLTSPCLSLAEIDMMVTMMGETNKKSGGKSTQDAHHQIQLCQFLEAIIRISVIRQRDWQKSTIDLLPDCLVEILEGNILRYEKVEMKQTEADKHTRQLFGLTSQSSVRVSEHEAWLDDHRVIKMLRIHRPALRSLFRKWAQTDDLREKLTLHEFMLLMRPSGLIGPDLTESQLLEAVGMTALGADYSQLAEWMQLVRENPSQFLMLFTEFVESLARAAFVKYADDYVATPDFKAHEFCQLLISGPTSKADPPPRPPPEPEDPPTPPPEPEKKKKKKKKP